MSSLRLVSFTGIAIGRITIHWNIVETDVSNAITLAAETSVKWRTVGTETVAQRSSYVDVWRATVRWHRSLVCGNGQRGMVRAWKQRSPTVDRPARGYSH